jgi:hypothetical protein
MRCRSNCGATAIAAPKLSSVPAPAHLSTDAAADRLNRRGITIASGKQWHTMLVRSARRSHKFAFVSGTLS